jgi:glycosyltransferase involved in cell wall biosynthesis
MTTRVSVITPAFNARRTLLRAYESLRAQTCQDWEHIIVDDGSTDDTPALIRELAGDERVRSIRIANSGTGAALNAGTALATGEFIGFLDADDEYLHNHLEAHLAVLAENPGIDLLWGGAEVITEDPNDAFVPDIVNGHGVIHASECVVQGTLFGRRGVFVSVRYSEDRSIWFQDYDFYVRACAHFTVQQFHLPTYRYYRNSGGSTIDRVKATWPPHDRGTAATA